MNLFVVVVSLFVAVQSTNACSCFPGHPQTTFCETDFALLGRIISKKNLGSNPINFDIEYTVEVINRVKNVPKPGKQMKFLTASNSAGCGVSFGIGTVHYLQGLVLIVTVGYLWIGRMRGPTRRLLFCDFLFSRTPAVWSYIYSKLKTNSYIRNCKCKIISKRGNETIPGPYCEISAKNTTRSCYKNQALCVSQGLSSCVWRYHEACETI